ncbi:MAG: hypothetical protein JXL81_06235 [Deltaproteobacteria bacterium]|nr:hypothetical protein [Deltaproteobacteria bacterium]
MAEESYDVVFYGQLSGIYPIDQVKQNIAKLFKMGSQKGIVGGIAMMSIAVIWFVVGYAAGIIFFYPPYCLFSAFSVS